MLTLRGLFSAVGVLVVLASLTLTGFYSDPLGALWWHAPWLLCKLHEAVFWRVASYYWRLDHRIANTLVERGGHFWTCLVLCSSHLMVPWLIGFGNPGYYEVSSWLGHSILMSWSPGLFAAYLEWLFVEVHCYKTSLIWAGQKARSVWRSLVFWRPVAPVDPAVLSKAKEDRQYDMHNNISENQVWKAVWDYSELLMQYADMIKHMKTQGDLYASAQRTANQVEMTKRADSFDCAQNLLTSLCTFPFVAWAVVPGRVIVVLVVCAISHVWQLQSAYLKNDVRRENRRAVHATFARLNRYEKTRP
jgi:hypothetical protein